MPYQDMVVTLEVAECQTGNEDMLSVADPRKLNILLSTPALQTLPPVKSPDPPCPHEILEAIRAQVVWI